MTLQGRLEKKVAIITGAARGIGKGIALRLVKEGCRVVVADIDFQGASKIKEEIDKMGGESLSIKVNVSKNKEVKKMVEMTLKEFGRIDILVNNAGVNKACPITELSEEGWDYILNVNLKGVFLCCKAVVPHMIKEKQGKIVNISSKVAKLGGRWLTAYSASKSGVVAFTQSLAREIAPHKINVNAICPGIIFTELWDGLKEKFAQKLNISQKEVNERYVKEIPLGRACTPEDVANVVVFLCSEESNYMTGQAINVTGGQEMR
jgi:acetoin reductase-like protein